jgi:hypothetical protein
MDGFKLKIHENPFKMDDVGGFLRDNPNNNHGDNRSFFR